MAGLTLSISKWCFCILLSGDMNFVILYETLYVCT